MKRYHVAYLIGGGYSSGVTIEAESFKEALDLFKKTFDKIKEEDILYVINLSLRYENN